MKTISRIIGGAKRCLVPEFASNAGHTRSFPFTYSENIFMTHLCRSPETKAFLRRKTCLAYPLVEEHLFYICERLYCEKYLLQTIKKFN